MLNNFEKNLLILKGFKVISLQLGVHFFKMISSKDLKFVSDRVNQYDEPVLCLRRSY